MAKIRSALVNLFSSYADCRLSKSYKTKRKLRNYNSGIFTTFTKNINLKNINIMNQLQFKTNINCGGCIEKVTPFMNETKEIVHWEVDTTNKDKILTVQTNSGNAQSVIDTIQKAGFKAEIFNQ